MDYLQYDDTASTEEENPTVLNLVINGLPSIPGQKRLFSKLRDEGVLNLVINGLPSILTKFLCFIR